MKVARIGSLRDGRGVLACAALALPFALLAAAIVYFTQTRSNRRAHQALEGEVQRLRREAAAGALTAGLSHELKNSLTILIGYAELAELAARRDYASEKLLGHIGTLQAELSRASGRLSAFLAFAGGKSEEKRAQNLAELLEPALALLRPLARMRELECEEEIDPSLRVEADGPALRELLVNLALNALAHAKTKIAIRASTAEKWIELRVEDDGAGIEAKAHAALFQRYSSKREGGTGLGLSLARETAIQHGGTLALESSAPGRTVFLVRLPAA